MQGPRALGSRFKVWTARLWEWLVSTTHRLSDPIDRWARRIELGIQRGGRGIVRGLAVAAWIILVMVLATIGALGVALMSAAVAIGFFEGPRFQQVLIVVGASAAALIVFLGSFGTAPRAGDSVNRFRRVIVAEFALFGIVGLSLGAKSLYTLFVT